MKYLLLLCCLLLSLTAFAQDAVTVHEDSIYSNSVQAEMKFLVILPKYYHHSDERHTTLYLLHGFGGNQTDWVKYTGLVKYLEDYNYIVVCPDARNSWYTNTPDGKKNFEDYILRDLIPAVDRKYRTLATRHGRAVAGLSMGGYGAMKFALKHPWVFMFAGSFSGALYAPAGSRQDNKEISESLKAAFGETKSDHWTKNDPFEFVETATAVNIIPYLYISAGKDDSFTRIVERNRAFAEKLRAKGVLYEYHELPGGHTWVFWDKEIRSFLQRLAAYDPLSP